MVVTILRLFVLAGAILADVYYLLAIYCARRFFRQPRAPANVFTPPVSVLKPVRGLDPEAYENFASFCRQEYPEYEILFAVRDENDPAVPAIRQVMRDFPNRSIRLLVVSDNLGPNDKASKLWRLAREARYDLLVASDSDIRVGRHYLRAVAASFRDPQVALVTCPFRGLAGPGFVSQVQASWITSHFLAGALTAWQLQQVRFAYGSTIAITRERLSAIGGFEGVADQIADDYQLGHRAAARGYRVELVPYTVCTACSAQTWRDLFQHQLRWLVVVRHCRPRGHFGLLLTYGLVWSLAAAFLTKSAALAVTLVGAYLLLRLLMAWTVGVWGLKDPLLRHKLWLVLLPDALGFPIWFVSLFCNRVEWRGRDFYVRKGRLIPVPAGPGAADPAR
jgi:ceramide glucosyltransferase